MDWEKPRSVVLVCREVEFSILGRNFASGGGGVRRKWRQSGCIFFFLFFFVSPLCRRWRQHAGPGCPDLTAPPWFSAVLPFGPPARIRMPSHPSSVRCSWSPALSQVSNGHFGLQFLFLNRPPISESCFNKHSIKRKKPLGDGRHPITEKQGMFTEESYISLVTSSLAKIYEPVCPTAIKLEMWSLNRCVFLINKTN